MKNYLSKTNKVGEKFSSIPLDVGEFFPADFFENYFEKKPLYLPKAFPLDVLHSLITLETLDNLIRSNSIPLQSLTFVREGVPVRGEAPETPKGKINFEAVRDGITGGGTFIFERISEISNPCKKISESLARFFGQRAMANAFVTPPNKKGFRAHIDGHHAVVIQVEGKKTWKIYHKYENGIERPTNHIRHTISSLDLVPDENSVEILELSEGDMLYLPIGAMHAPYCNDEFSFHITVGIHPLAWSDYLKYAIDILTLSDPDFRQGSPLKIKGKVQNFDHLKENLDKLLKKISDLDPERVEHFAFRDLLANEGTFGHSFLADAVKSPKKKGFQGKSFSIYLADRADFRIFKNTEGKWQLWTLNHKCQLYEAAAKVILKLLKEGKITNGYLRKTLGEKDGKDLVGILRKFGIVGIRF